MIGVPLLQRGNRGVSPTAAGEAFLHHARQIVRSTEQLRTEMREYAQGARGHVRVLANISSLSQFLPRDISRFLAAHEHVRIDLQERVTSEIVAGVRDGQADLGVCVGAAAAHGLQTMPYRTDRLVVLVHPQHPLAARSSVSFEETMDYRFVNMQPHTATSVFLAGLAARAGRTLDYRMHVGTFDAICHVVAEGLAIAIVASGAVRLLQGVLGLETVALTDGWAEREIVMCMRSYEALSMPARALVDELGASASRASGRGE